MTKAIHKIINCETQEIQEIELTNAELAEMKALSDATELEMSAKAKAKMDLLSKLGITETEAKLLLS